VGSGADTIAFCNNSDSETGGGIDATNATQDVVITTSGVMTMGEGASLVLGAGFRVYVTGNAAINFPHTVLGAGAYFGTGTSNSRRDLYKDLSGVLITGGASADTITAKAGVWLNGPFFGMMNYAMNPYLVISDGFPSHFYSGLALSTTEICSTVFGTAPLQIATIKSGASGKVRLGGANYAGTITIPSNAEVTLGATGTTVRLTASARSDDPYDLSGVILGGAGTKGKLTLPNGATIATTTSASNATITENSNIGERGGFSRDELFTKPPVILTANHNTPPAAGSFSGPGTNKFEALPDGTTGITITANDGSNDCLLGVDLSAS
jgi:hypothetical protein